MIDKSANRPSPLAAAIQVEIKRNYKLIQQYLDLPEGVGAFGATAIQHDLDYAHEALAEDDILKILKAYHALKTNA